MESNSSVWLGTNFGLQNYVDGSRIDYSSENIGENDYITDLAIDASGNIWVIVAPYTLVKVSGDSEEVIDINNIYMQYVFNVQMIHYFFTC